MKKHQHIVLFVTRKEEDAVVASRTSNLFYGQTAFSTQEALETIGEQSFAAMVIWADQFEIGVFLTRVSLSPYGKSLPVLVVGDLRDEDYVLRNGAAKFLDKRMSGMELKASIENFLGLDVTVDFRRPDGETAKEEDPLRSALEAARQLVSPSSQFAKDDEQIENFGPGESLKEIVEEAASEFRSDTVEPFGTEMSEGLDDIDVQAYVPAQAFIEERFSPEDSHLPKTNPGTPVGAGRTSQAFYSIDQSTQSSPISDVAKTDAFDQSFDSIRQESRNLVAPDSSLDAVEQAEQLPPDEDIFDSAKTQLRDEKVQGAHLDGSLLPGEGVQPTQDLSEDGIEMETGHRDTMHGASSSTGSSAISSAIDDAASGRIEDTPVWKILAMLLEQKFSGELLLSSRDTVRSIVVDTGIPILVNSNHREDRLIELLFREGRLTERQYENAALTIGSSGRKAGVVMVERGIISSRELFPLVRYHYESLLYDSFSWKTGKWSFETKADKTTERILLDIAAEALIVEGIRSKAREQDISALVPAGSVPRRVPSGIGELENASLSPLEMEVLEWCDGERVTDELAEKFNMDEYELRSYLAGLVVLGWISVDGGISPEQSVATLEKEEKSPFESADLNVERARVADKMAQVHESTYFAILEIPPSASGYEIRKSYRRLRGLFAPGRFVGSQISDLQAEVDIIGTVLEEAYQVLRNSSLRESYRSAIGTDE